MVTTTLHLKVALPDDRQFTREFSSFPVRIGRGRENDLILDDGDVSRHHAEIYTSGDQVFIRDCRSLNGVRINGELTDDDLIVPGDDIQLGKSHIVYLSIDAVPDGEEPGNEIFVRPDGTTGVLEVIRAIDIDKVLHRPIHAEEEWTLQPEGSPEETREQYRKLHVAYSNLHGIMNLVSNVGKYTHPGQICAQFVSALRRVFPAVENVYVIESDPEHDGEYRVIHEERDEEILHVVQPSRTVLGRVLNELRAIYAVDASRDPRFLKSDSVRVRGVRSMMCAPLIIRGEATGAIYVENISQPYCFGHFDLNLLMVFAFHLGLALETARLMEERDKAFDRAATTLKSAKQDKIALILQYSQSEKKFRALFEQSALGAAVVNLITHRIEEVNDGLVRMLGFTRRQLAGSDFSTLLAEPDRTEANDWLLHVRQNGEGACKSNLHTSNSQPLVALQSCRALRMGDSQVMVAYFIDITAKERAEEETRKQLQRVTALSELSQALMTTMNSEDIYELLFAKVQSVLPIDHLFIGLLSNDDESLRVVYTAKRSAEDNFVIETEPHVIAADNIHVRRVLSNRESFFLDFAQETTELSKRNSFPRNFPEGEALQSAIFVPLTSRNKLNGVVCVQSQLPNAYDQSHLETLRALVAQAALALSNARAFEAIREQEENLRQLSLQIMTAQETERGRISRELHDGVGQQLTAMKYILEGIRNAAKAQDPDKLMNRIGEARELATQIIDDLRSISLDLRPTMLDDLGLKPTLDWFIRQFSNRTEIDVELNCDLDETLVRPEIATATYRIIQEALGNVAKHAKANLVKVKVWIEAEELLIEVRDDGIGFKANTLQSMQAQRGCSGMLNMKERAHFLGGNFRLETAPGKGTKLSLAIPVKETNR